MANVLQVSQGETVTAYVLVRSFDKKTFLVMATRDGLIKKVRIEDFGNIRRSGIIADIHDQLVFEMYPEDANCVTEIKTEMERFPQFGRVPIITEDLIGMNLLEMKEAERIQEVVDYIKGGPYNEIHRSKVQ